MREFITDNSLPFNFMNQQMPNETGAGLLIHGFTMIELVMVITILSILAVVAIPNFMDLGEDARDAVTRDEMLALKRAIVGDSRVVAGGKFAFPGYDADNGGPHSALVDLVTKPGGASVYNPLTRRGWRGPYIDDSATSEYSKDTWDNAYVYSTSPRRIRSKGPNGVDDGGAADDIDLTF